MSETQFLRLLDVEEENEIDQVVNFSTDENSGVYLSGGGPRRRIDYVLVFETCQGNEETSEESAADALKLTALRTSFENQLERRGLILQRETRVVQKVCRLLICFPR